jgi:hypothetical protein
MPFRNPFQEWAKATFLFKLCTDYALPPVLAEASGDTTEQERLPISEVYGRIAEATSFRRVFEKL